MSKPSLQHPHKLPGKKHLTFRLVIEQVPGKTFVLLYLFIWNTLC